MPHTPPLRHLLLQKPLQPEPYSPRSRGGENPTYPDRDREAHATRLLTQLAQAKDELALLHQQRLEKEIEERGFFLQVESEPGFELALKSLDRSRDGIELLAVLPQGQESSQIATLFVAHGKVERLEKIIRDYREKDRGQTSNPANQALVATSALTEKN